MKTFIISLICLLTLSCSSLNIAPNENLTPEQKNDRIALVVENTIYPVLLLTFDDLNNNQKEDFKKYVNAIILLTDNLVLNKQTSLADLQTALANLDIKESDSIKFKVVAPMIISVYDTWYKESLKNNAQIDFVLKKVRDACIKFLAIA